MNERLLMLIVQERNIPLISGSDFKWSDLEYEAATLSILISFEHQANRGGEEILSGIRTCPTISRGEDASIDI